MKALDELVAAYRAALTDYAAGGGEAALLAAHDAGLAAARAGLNTLDVVVVHRRLAAAVGVDDDAVLLEALAPVELERRRQRDEVERQLGAMTRIEREREAAEDRANARGRFLARMSHELRTPLTAINGFASMLASQRHGQLSRRQLEFVRNIRAAGEHQLAIVNDVLDLSKVEAGRMELSRRWTDVGELVSATLATMRPLARARGLALNHELPPKDAAASLTPAFVDPTRLRQILVNLVSNAIKFTPQGGVAVTVSRADRWLSIAVRDTGVGIAAERLDTLFDEFQRVDADQGGSGLGLALVARLAALHQGSVEVVSEVGRGTVFTVTLPVLHPAPRVVANEPGQLPRVVVSPRDGELSAALEALGMPQPIESARPLAVLAAGLADALVVDPLGPDAPALLARLRMQVSTVGTVVLYAAAATEGLRCGRRLSERVRAPRGLAAAWGASGWNITTPTGLTVAVIGEDPAAGAVAAGLAELGVRVLEGASENMADVVVGVTDTPAFRNAREVGAPTLWLGGSDAEVTAPVVPLADRDVPERLGHHLTRALVVWRQRRALWDESYALPSRAALIEHAALLAARRGRAAPVVLAACLPPIAGEVSAKLVERTLTVLPGAMLGVAAPRTVALVVGGIDGEGLDIIKQRFCSMLRDVVGPPDPSVVATVWGRDGDGGAELLDAAVEGARGATGGQDLASVTGTILVVEDHALNREMMATLLQERGHRVVTAHDGRSARLAWRRHEIHVVVMDIQLPDVRGPQLLAELRRQGPRGRVPILAVTAEAMVGDEARLLEAGFDGYLAKPLDVARFVEVVEQHLRGSGPPAASEPVVSTPKKRRPQREPTTRNPAFRSRLETLRTRFAISLPRQVAELRDALEHARGGDPQAALERAHRIAGAAGSFGFEREGQLARTIEEAIRGLQAADRLREAGQEWQEIDAAMGELLAVVGE